QGSSYKYLAAIPTHLPAVTYITDFVAGRVGDLPQTAAIRPRGFLITLCWCSPLQRFMRPLVVELVAKQVEGLLLLPQISPRRLCRRLFQSAVHPLVLTVLRRLARFNPLRPDSQLDPPDTQLTQSSNSYARERRPVVGSDARRHSILPKHCIKQRLRRDGVGILQTLAPKEKTAIGIGDRQGITAAPIFTTEPSLKVRTPNQVRSIGLL